MPRVRFEIADAEIRTARTPKERREELPDFTGSMTATNRQRGPELSLLNAQPPPHGLDP
jgi:hypothetical protein